MRWRAAKNGIRHFAQIVRFDICLLLWYNNNVKENLWQKGGKEKMEDFEEMANAAEALVDQTEQKAYYKALLILEKCKSIEEATDEIQKLLKK